MHQYLTKFLCATVVKFSEKKGCIEFGRVLVKQVSLVTII